LSGRRAIRLLSGVNKLARTLACLLTVLACRDHAFAQNAVRTEPKYLAFQVFTSSPNLNTAFGADHILRGIPSKETLSAYARDLIGRIGTTGGNGAGASRKLALILGPLAFDQPDAQVRDLISTAFDLALENDIAVGFHIDDSMFWGRRQDLLADPANLERADWTAPPNTGRRLDWGPKPTKAPPVMCINSPAIEREVRNRATVIGNAVSAGVARLRDAHREDLFAAVIAGWETQIGREFPANRPLGFCALANRGVKPGASDAELYDGRVAAVADFVTLWTGALADAGVPGDRIYSHIAFAMAASKEPRQNFAPPSVAFGAHRRPGFSTYPGPPRLYDELAEAIRANGGGPWASTEGANVLLVFGAMDSGMGMETYLAKLYDRGVALVTIFGWGLGDKDNVFRRAAENADALTAYRKFLNGQTLVEGPVTPTILDRVQQKMARVQSELPLWVQRYGRHVTVKQLTDALTTAMQTGDPVRVEAALDAILVLITG
jgi:hypothetical protein